MKNSIKTACLLLICLVITACSSGGIKPKEVICPVAGAIVGGALLNATVGHDDDEESDEIAAGAVVGALVGYVLCRDNTPDAPSDSDGDGVYDRDDKCPDTPPGTEVDLTGCPKPLDTDGDGVNDPVDECPGTPPNTPVDHRGCPKDSDGDGVIDRDDQCPDTPAGTPVDSVGCPESGDVMLSLTGINFATDSASVKGSEAILDEAVKALNANAYISVKVMVEGHTDSRYSESYNQALSERRAQSVVDYLVSQGIAADRLTAIGYGESKPVAPNDTAANMYKNRRVDFVVK